jgi:cell division protein FtsL
MHARIEKIATRALGMQVPPPARMRIVSPEPAQAKP